MSPSVFSSISDPRIVALLIAGELGVIPTDTIYGLAARASNRQAVEHLYALKRRERKPGTIIAASAEQLIQLGLDEQTVRAVAHLWPNPVSIIILAAPTLGYIDQGLGDLAVRIPADDQLRDVLMQTGPLVTSSANQPGEPPATTVLEAQHCFVDGVAFYVDGGDRSGRPASTVVRYKDGRFETLRQGAVTITPDGQLI